MAGTFAVIRARGPSWIEGLDLRAQAGWEVHARFMEDLVTDGFVIVGGPLPGSPEVLLIVAAESERQVRERLGRDPWEPAGLLATRSVRPWEILLGSLKA